MKTWEGDPMSAATERAVAIVREWTGITYDVAKWPGCDLRYGHDYARLRDAIAAALDAAQDAGWEACFQASVSGTGHLHAAYQHGYEKGRAALDAAVAAERERCIKRICAMCGGRVAWEVRHAQQHDGTWCHWVTGKGDGWWKKCKAAALRDAGVTP